MSYTKSRESLVFDTVLIIVMLLLTVVTVYPFLNILALSFNNAIDSVKGGIYLWPRMPTLANYAEIFNNKNLVTGFQNSILRTVIGTLTNVFCCTMMAYTLSRKDFMARRLFSLMFAVTMYVSGGMIPGYLLIRDLHMFSTFVVYIIPMLLSAWNIIVIRSFIDGLPESLQEAARVDGANDVFIFIRIVLPLCKPVLATMALFVAVSQWNSWFDSYLYNNSRPDLTTLQYELQKMLTTANITPKSATDTIAMNAIAQANRVTPDALKMAMTMVVTAPVLLVYPFLQRYFVTGLTLGAVKS